MTHSPLYWMSACVGIAAYTAHAGDWPQFRGPNRDGMSNETNLLRGWPDAGPKKLWEVSVCEGYAGAAIVKGRVYFNDYDTQANAWLVRCLDLSNGSELWRFSEKKVIRPNHGITRTVPAVDGQHVFSLDPKCVFHCLDAKTGEEKWQKKLTSEYGTRIPPWYAGQCPLIEEDRVLIAPGGSSLVVALDKGTGNTIWATPNPEGWPMSHASLMPARLGGVDQYLYCTLQGAMGVAADDGRLLWFHPYKFNVCVPTSPLAIDEERVFLTSGYDAGSVMIRVKNDGGTFRTEELFRLTGNDWNSEVHTPLLHNGHMYGVGKTKRGLFTCLDFDGKEVWTSIGKASFDLGGYMIADGMFIVLDGKTGTLRMLDANASSYVEIASAQVLSGPDVWAPPALADGKLVIRDLTRMVCLDVSRADESQ